MELNRTIEVWRQIPGFGGKYSISNYGRVLSRQRQNNKVDIIMKNAINHKGYPHIMLVYKGDRKSPLIHRLVAEAFIPNPRNLPQVNHKNGIKTDNYWENLEWVSAKENVHHCWANGMHTPTPIGGLHHNSRSIVCIETGEIFLSIADARRKYPKGGGGITTVLAGKVARAAGFTWRYTSPEEIHLVREMTQDLL